MKPWHSQPKGLLPFDEDIVKPQRHIFSSSTWLFDHQPVQREGTEARYGYASNESSMSLGKVGQRARVQQSEIQHREHPLVSRGAETSENFLYTAARLRSMPSSALLNVEDCCDLANTVLVEYSEGGGPSLERNLDILNRLNEVTTAIS